MKPDFAGKPAPVTTPETESLMSVVEFGATHPINRTLLAGFTHYCQRSKVPPRLTATQWHTALTNWQRAPVAG
jgi:hypothetical protein